MVYISTEYVTCHMELLMGKMNPPANMTGFEIGTSNLLHMLLDAILQ